VPKIGEVHVPFNVMNVVTRQQLGAPTRHPILCLVDFEVGQVLTKLIQEM
jgi:hypothetical protein